MGLNKQRLATIGLGMALFVSFALVGTQAATAATPAGAEPTQPLVVVSAPMTFHYGPVVAAGHGYSVRTTASGDQYAVPSGTPEGSMVGATPLAPGLGKARVSSNAAVSPDGTVGGNCGTSFVEWTSIDTFKTGYTVYAAWGYAISQSWHVAVDTNKNTTSYDLSGLAPAFSFSWDASRTVSFGTGVYRATALAGGTAETDFGEYTSAGPTSVNEYL